jgi:cyclohexadienyl dehydratase
MSHALRLFVGTLLIVMHGLVMADDDRLQRIETAQTLRVCIWPDYYGISFRNPKTRQLSGIDVDLARDLAQDLGVEVEFVDSAFATLIEDVSATAATSPCSPSASRRRDRKICASPSRIWPATSMPSPPAPTGAFRDWADIDQPGTVVAVAKGTLHESVMREKLQHAELRMLDTPHAREQEVQSGTRGCLHDRFPLQPPHAQQS